jgi:hypothetical protein
LGAAQTSEQESRFFFEKKNQKTFGIWRVLLDGGAMAIREFAVSFFS